MTVEQPMITAFITPFVEAKDEFVSWLLTQDYPSYESLLRKSLELIQGSDGLEYDNTPDPQRIHTIDDGDYQGTLLFVVGATGYQPSNYWLTAVDYGSCSGCDALERAWGYGNDRNMEGMYLIALHMVQGLRVVWE